MEVMPQNLVSNYECKSGEKVEFDTFYREQGLCPVYRWIKKKFFFWI